MPPKQDATSEPQTSYAGRGNWDRFAANRGTLDMKLPLRRNLLKLAGADETEKWGKVVRAGGLKPE